MEYLKTLESAPDSSKPMPEPRRINIESPPSGMNERFYLESFMGKFDSKWNETKIIKDKTGFHDLAVSALIFTDHKTGKSKVTKNGRAPYVLYVAQTILDPDEIRISEGGHGDRSLFLLARYLIKGDILNVISMFKEDGKVWTGWTGYQDHRPEYIENKRNGVLIYRQELM